MPNYHFRARRRDGAEQVGVIDAADPGALATRLRGQGMLVLEVKDAPPESGRTDRLPTEKAPLFAFGPSLQDIENALRQLALLLESGVSIVEALESIGENTRSRKLGYVLRQVRARVIQGNSFHGALAEHPAIFSSLVVELVRAGEQSGTLEIALERSAGHIEQRRTIRAAVLQALMYPSLVVVMTSLVASVMVVKVIPELEKFLSGSGHRLPAITRALLAFTHVVNATIVPVTIGLIALVIGLIICDRYPPTQRVIDRATFSIPFLRRIRVLGATSLFARSLGVLVSSGVPLTIALETSERILSRPTPQLAIRRARECVLRGDPLHRGLTGKIPFAPILARMIRIGEQSGALDRVLLDSARFHELELQQWIKRASLIIEPVITILVGAIVGFVYTAFFAAMFSLAGGG